MLRFLVLLAVVACAFGQNGNQNGGQNGNQNGGQNDENNTQQQAALTGEEFKQAVSKYDHVQKQANQECTRPEQNKIQYTLYTREKPNGEIIKDNAINISGSSLNVKKNLKVIVHSWLQNKNWVKPVVNDYLYSQNVDVLVVDWSEYAENCNIESTSIYVTPFVGESLAYLLRTIIGLGHSGYRMHLIGFSHGAHIAGIAGRMMAPHLPARITALDPLRLDELDQPGGGKLMGGDAKFIDVIVTSMPGLSFEYEIGDVTFFPNGGFSKYQERCDDKEDAMEKMICSHSLAYKLFGESLVSPHKFPAVRCESYSKFLSGKCTLLDSENYSLAHMGEYVEWNARGRYFLEINKDYPYDKGYNLPGPVEA